MYAETHTTITNANGLVNIAIGTGTVTSGSFAAIDWSAGPYFTKIEIDPAGGTTYSIASISELLSVPYALYAGSAANGFSGDYNNLTNKPTIQNLTFLNIGTGLGSLNSITSGNSNTAYGFSSLLANTSGYCNTAFGLFTLMNNKNGFLNTAIGFDVLHNNSSGYYNTATGQSSLFENTTG